jgi:DNA polymerase-3 subunit delta'
MADAAVTRTPGHGRFITFEGGEGSGKSTQIKTLAERLNAAKLRTIVTREPGGSPGAEIIRHLVLSGMGKLLGPDAETLLFAAARDDHVRSVIKPALKQGTWVLCDRFSDSTRAYQGSLGKVSPAVLNAMERVTIGDLKPDLTIILDVPVEVGMKRAAARRGTTVPDRFEGEDLNFHQKIRRPALRVDRCHGRAQYRCRERMDRLARPSPRGRRRKRGQFGMSARQVEAQRAAVHPRETTALFGHREAETALLNAYRSGRIPHAWLIGGAAGIGKATLAYRMARFVLTHRNPHGADVQRAETLRVDPSEPVARQVAAGAHGGLLTLERTLNDKGVMRTVITVDETRQTIPFFGSTAAAEGWRVCIVDTVDELNPNGANALLKVLEEPPQQSLFLLVSHAPARVLPTILSRCRKLLLRPLATENVIRAVAEAGNIAADDPSLVEAAGAAEGSVARALTLLGGDALKLQQRTTALLAALPRVDPRELHALGDALGGSDRVPLAAFIDSVDRWVSERLRANDVNANADLPRLARLAEVWEKINRAARDTAEYNLDRKPLVFSVFGLLAEATR